MLNRETSGGKKECGGRDRRPTTDRWKPTTNDGPL